MVQLLLECGADPNLQDNWDDTALTATAYHSDPVLIQTLLDNGADPNIRGNCGYTALINAASRDNCPAIVQLLRHGTIIDAQDTSGHTALHMALSLRCYNAARLLIEYGANTHDDELDWRTRQTFDTHVRNYADIIKQKRKERLMKCMSVCGRVDENIVLLILSW
jgi:ankyrin repeat protein